MLGEAVVSESNTLAATALFGAAIAVDALTALDPPSGDESPAALRLSSVVLVACLAAPPIRQWMVFEQRLVIAVPLLAVALVGRHTSAEGARAGDALFVLLTFAACVYVFWSGGTENKGAPGARTARRPLSEEAPPYTRREALVCLALSALLYSSFRLVRNAFEHPIATRDFTLTTTAYDGAARTSMGYAYASSTTTAAVALGGATGAGVAVALFISTELRAHGTGVATLVLVVSALLQLTSAFVATLAQSEAPTNLPAIWSTGACAAPTTCPAAHLARRNSLVGQCSSALWLNGLGTLVLAYAPSLRLRSRVAMLTTERNFEMVVYALVCAAACVGFALQYLAFSGGEALTDYAVVGALVALFLAACVDSIVGVLLFAACLSVDLAMVWLADGATGVFAHLPHCATVTMLVLMALYVFWSASVELLWRWLPAALVEAFDEALGVLVVAGTSVALGTYLMACAIYASYDGELYDEVLVRAADNRFARTSAATAMTHWLPLLLWLPLYGCRCEAEMLSWPVRAAAWYGAAAVPIVTWLVALAATDAGAATVVGWYGSAPFTVAIGSIVVVPWVVLPWA